MIGLFPNTAVSPLLIAISGVNVARLKMARRTAIHVHILDENGVCIISSKYTVFLLVYCCRGGHLFHEQVFLSLTR